ncbi:MAG TPA: IPTL-CTERM sorting domain-containing protein [Thermodesulfobacteriota bacterium]|nr:IPTL-CTERM sorting domain-containing protein [Thermodesulfobacteriota bacterium]
MNRYPCLGRAGRLSGFLVFAFLFLPLVVSADAVQFTNEEVVFLENNPEVELQRFNSRQFAEGTFVNCTSPVDVSSNDDCFTPGFISPFLTLLVDLMSDPTLFALLGADFEGGGNPPNVLITSIPVSSFDILFEGPKATAVGLDIGCVTDDEEACITELLVDVFGSGSGPIGSTTVLAGESFDSFLGIESAEPISRVSIYLTVQDASVFQGVERIWFEPTPNVAPIPTLSEWGMIAAAAGLALIGMIYAARRRKAGA